MTNIFLVSIVLTNWISVPGDWKREAATNYEKQRLVISTNTFVVESRVCYTSNLVHQVSDTNGPTRWSPVELLPGTPGKL